MFLPLDMYQPAATAIGAAGGSGIGAAIGGALGQVGGVLSAPRRYLWGALGLPDSGAEVLHQYAGMDPDSWLTKGLGMGVEMAGDPLTYAGMVPGLFGGAKLGAQAGEGLLGAALAKGPEYAGGAEKLLQAPGMGEILAEAAGSPGGKGVFSEYANGLQSHLGDLQASPGFARALAEIPPGSEYYGHGAEALALKTPAGDILRLQPQRGDRLAGMARPNIPEVLQPTRAGMAGAVRVERSPVLQGMADRAMERGQMSAGGDIARDMRDSIRERGYDPGDVTPWNIGWAGEEPKVFDSGAVLSRPGGPQPPALGQLGQDPGGMSGWLLRALGSDQAVQQRLAEQAMAGPQAGVAGAPQSMMSTPTGGATPQLLRRLLARFQS